MGFRLFSETKKPGVDPAPLGHNSKIATFLGLGNKFATKRCGVNLVLDIGTEAVKGLIFEKNEKISVLGSSLEYYDQYSTFFTPYFEREIIKRTISKVLKELERETKLNPVRKEALKSIRDVISEGKREGLSNGVKPVSVILSLPPDIFGSRVIVQSYKRKGGLIGKKEREEILERVRSEGKKKISQIYGKEKGILAEHLQILDLKILEIKIDGYLVPDILNYAGRNLEFRILANFLPRDYLISNFSPVSILKEMDFERLRISHPVEGLILTQNLEGIFLDIGGKLTQIFLAKNGNLEKISEFNRGGKEFSQLLSERLGLEESDARSLKERYSKRDITEESRQRIREFFDGALKIWFKNLKEKLREMSSGIFPAEIFIFGGGGLLPEIEEILEEGDWGDVSFSQPPKIKFLQPPGLNLSSQYISPLLCYYASCIGN